MIEPEILEILKSSTCDGNNLSLNCGQLDRKTYTKVNDVLERLGGKWNRKLRAHVFPGQADEILWETLETGEMPDKNPLCFFETPSEIAHEMLQLANINNLPKGSNILEPSAGRGAIIKQLASHLFTTESGRLGEYFNMTAIEVNPIFADELESIDGVNVFQMDFLYYSPTELFDLILMNPPYTAPGDRLAYITHIDKALSLLKVGGKLVSIAPLGFTFRQDKRCKAFIDEVKDCGYWVKNEPDAFKSSGTMVNTAIIVMQKTVPWDDKQIFSEDSYFASWTP